MSDLSRTREARRALKTFLKARALTGDPRAGNTLARRWSLRPGQGTVYLLQSDIRTLLRSEREAHRAAAVQSRKAAEAARVVAVLQQENTALQADLARKIQDPPGSHERTSLQRAEELLAVLPTPALWQRTCRELDAAQCQVRELTAERDRAVRARDEAIADAAQAREQRDNLLGTSDPQATEIRRLRQQADALARERDSLQRALGNLRDSVRKGAPENTFASASAPGGLSAEDLQRVAKDLLPQILETFFKGGRK